MLVEVWWLHIKSLVATIEYYWLQVPIQLMSAPHGWQLLPTVPASLSVPQRRAIILAGIELMLWRPGSSFISPNSPRTCDSLTHQSLTSTTSSSLRLTSLQELGQLLYNILLPLLTAPMDHPELPSVRLQKPWLYSWLMQAKGPLLQVADCLEWAPGEQKIKSKPEKDSFLKKKEGKSAKPCGPSLRPAAAES